MIVEPERYMEDFARAGADLMSIHIEAVPDLRRAIERIRALGKKAGGRHQPATRRSTASRTCSPTWRWCW